MTECQYGSSESHPQYIYNINITYILSGTWQRNIQYHPSKLIEGIGIEMSSVGSAYFWGNCHLTIPSRRGRYFTKGFIGRPYIYLPLYATVYWSKNRVTDRTFMPNLLAEPRLNGRGAVSANRLGTAGREKFATVTLRCYMNQLT